MLTRDREVLDRSIDHHLGKEAMRIGESFRRRLPPEQALGHAFEIFHGTRSERCSSIEDEFGRNRGELGPEAPLGGRERIETRLEHGSVYTTPNQPSTVSTISVSESRLTRIAMPQARTLWAGEFT